MDEIARIIEAAKADDGAEDKVRILIDHMTKAAADKAAGVEDTAAGLKSALAKVKAELDSYKQLGRPDEIQAISTRLRTLEAEAEAGAHGVDNDAVEKLAEERAERKSRTRIAEANAELERLQKHTARLEQDRNLLVDRLAASYIDHDLYKNGGDKVDPLFMDVLRSKAKPFYEIAGSNGDTEEGQEWWRKPDPPEFRVVDPKDPNRTRLSGKDGPMSTKELIEAKRRGEWAALWPDHRSGGGAGSGDVGATSRTFGIEDSASSIIQAAISSG